MKKHIEIDGRRIGPDAPPYIICELSGNHNGSLDRALKLVDAAAKTGCDAIKIQTYRPESMTLKSDAPDFKITGGLWDGRTLYDLYEEAHTPYEWHEAIFQRARENGVTLFSTPFDEAGADLLETLDAPAYKIASFEMTDLALISYVAGKGKPMIISTGLANLAEIEMAVKTAHAGGCDDIILLHCVSSYPAPEADSNLRTIPHLSAAFDVIGGLSDHTLGTATSVASVALGGCVIEKHFTLARSDGGPDAEFSLEPEEFERLVNDCGSAWVSLGQVTYKTQPAEKQNLSFRRSIYATHDIAKGVPFSKQNVKSIRPGFGLAPKHLPDILDQFASTDIPAGTPLDWKHISKIRS